ncbi:MAG TPA: GtrA family protein [Candidatus Nanopelagicaceae bacterium]|nr:GtrA family protein [Candidatus Nanopelagicaceae bacterium]
MAEKNVMKRQMILYFIFAACMILLNYIIQKINQLAISPYICSVFGGNDFIQVLYCSTNPIDMPVLIGSIVATGITYIIKFFLDKYLVFKKTSLKIKETSEEFSKYFGFAILTTIENIGIQFILTNLFNAPLEVSVIIALSIGYVSKFFLDRKYVFTKEY